MEDVLLDLDDAPEKVIDYKENLKIHKPNTKDIEQLTNEYYKEIEGVQGYVILKKIGQYPSIADMQFFECVKYKSILNKNNKYRDYTMAL
ncbi:hypothetical protein [Lachnoanaerobaculum gingivalis]|uniref:hypothetical protein n=1 Tax=Lachnoanaerobaculum gingivalis TaxID=2490855 RepID=UPI0024A69B32|nr:hypothetical protein [Lachnoanaerobaculum gingivalis]WHE87573.1 hypothetical protein QJR73_00745 [Lachnoanaerobaculum gingivalis]